MLSIFEKLLFDSNIVKTLRRVFRFSKFFLWVDDFPMSPILKVFVNLGCIMKFYRCKCLWYSICAISNCIEKPWKINERVQLRDDFLFVESIFYLYCCKFIMSLYKHTLTYTHRYIYITVHHVPKGMSCHKAIVVITGWAHFFHDCI